MPKSPKNCYLKQPIEPADMAYKVDQQRLVKWCKHMASLNEAHLNDFSKPYDFRSRAEARMEAYKSILYNIRLGIVVTEKVRKGLTKVPESALVLSLAKK